MKTNSKPSKSSKSSKLSKPSSTLNSNKNKKKENFDDTMKDSWTGIIDSWSVSPTAGDNPVTWQDQMQDYFILVLKYLFLVTILTLNFLGLSVSLNCNAQEELTKRILSAVFAFFFGFVYLVINYYTYKVLTHGKICKMDRTKLFPFKV